MIAIKLHPCEQLISNFFQWFDRLLLQHEDLLNDGDRVHEVISALQRSGLLLPVGEIYQRTGKTDRAMEAYRKGHAYAKAIELARLSFPAGCNANYEFHQIIHN